MIYLPLALISGGILLIVIALLIEKRKVHGSTVNAG